MKSGNYNLIESLNFHRIRAFNLFSRYVLYLFLVVFFTNFSVNAQTFTAGISPGSLSVCGETQTITLTFVNDSGGTLNNEEFSIDLSNAGGFELTDLVISGDAPADATYDSATGIITSPSVPIEDGETWVFELTLNALCGFATEPEIFFGFTSEQFTLAEPLLIDGFAVFSPALSITAPFIEGNLRPQNIFDAAIGVNDTLLVPVTNAGQNSLLGDFIYCIEQPTSVDLVGIVVAGSFIPAALADDINGNTYCFLIDSASFPGNSSGGVDNSDEFLGFNESINIGEIWTGNDCSSNDPIVHFAQFGCGAALLDACQASAPVTTGVDYDFALPELVAGVHIPLIDRPACYAESPSTMSYYIVNNGVSDAVNVSIDVIAPGNGTIIPTGFVASTNADGTGTTTNGVITSSTAASGGESCSSGGGVNVSQANATFEGVNLAPGDTLYITVQLAFGCNCNGCTVEDVYWIRLSGISWEDGCEREFFNNDDVQYLDSQYDTRLTGFFEGESYVTGTSGCVNYTITSGFSHFFANNDGIEFPDAYIQSIFETTPGVNITSVTNVNNSGNATGSTTLNPADPLNNTSADGSDTVIAETTANVNGSIEVCFDIDCEETGGGCPSSASIALTNYLVTDPSCTCKDNVSCESEIEFVFDCPPCQPCDGLTHLELDICRVNYGDYDANDDGVSDGVGLANMESPGVKKNRFLAGDTIKARLVGIVNDGTPLPTPHFWEYAFLEMNMNTDNFTILGGEFSVFDASANTTLTCNALSQFVNPTDSESMITDISAPTLANLACSDFAGFEYADGDSLFLCVYFSPKEQLVDVQSEPYIYNPAWYLSDAAYGLGTEDRCNFLVETMNQIGVYYRNEVDINNNFGGCQTSPFSHQTRIHYGALGFDEFCNEIRHPGAPLKYTYVKPPEFAFADEFGLRVIEYVGPDVTFPNLVNGPIPPQFFSINGDTLCFFAKDYYDSVPGIVFDEDMIFTFYPAIQGNCQSKIGAYSNSTQVIYDVDDNVFCQDTYTFGFDSQNFTYTGGPVIEVNSLLPEVQIFQKTGCSQVEITNTTNIPAPNTFLNINDINGGLVVTSVIEDPNGAATNVPANAFGIFELGTFPAGGSATYEVCVSLTDCEPQQLEFIAGWDCNVYPTTVEEALCSDPSYVDFISVPGGLDMALIAPTEASTIPLCESVEYIVAFSSNQLGYLDEIDFFFTLPNGMEYVGGTFEIAYPVPTSGDTTFVNVADPNNLFDNLFNTEILGLDSFLADEGLIGSLGSPTNTNIVLIRYQAITNCDYRSGSRPRFISRATDACGNRTPRISIAGTRIFIDNAVPEYDITINLGSLEMNACAEDQETVLIDMAIEANPGITTSVGDSVSVALPLGINYISTSYNAISNASTNSPVIQTNNGQNTLVWPLQAGLVNGDVVQFELDIEAVDVGQQCQEYEMIVSTYSTTNASCGDVECSIGVLSGEESVFIDVVKPELVFQNFDLNLLNIPPSNQLLEYTYTVCNDGSVDYDAPLEIDLYSDNDNNGILDTAVDNISATITDNVTVPPGNCVTVTNTAVVNAGTLCKILATIDIDNNCTCDTDISNQIDASIQNDFENEYEVCSGDIIQVGPPPVTGFDYEWLSYNGSNLTALSATNTTTVDLQFSNTSGADINWDYIVRTSFGNCYTYDTVKVTIFPENIVEVDVAVCEGDSFVLPGSTTGSNFQWSPTTDLDNPNIAFPTLNPVPAGGIYTLSYTDEDGCNASRLVNLSGIGCAPNTGIGDTVWYDLNENGLQDLGGEIGIPNVTVFLYYSNNTSTGNHISATTTDANGYYEFTGLPAGNYVVGFIDPAGFVSTATDVAAGPDEDDSDAGAGGLTGAYFLPNGTFNPTVDAGYIPNCNLEMEVSLVGGCVETLLGYEREYEITITWTNAVYTEDFLGGEDNIVVDVNGTPYNFLITELSGDTTLVYNFDVASGTSFSGMAFLQNDADCITSLVVNDVVGCTYDIALIKDIDAANLPSPLAYGSTIPFIITLENQGENPLTNILINDYLPAGYSFSASANPGWSLTSSTLLNYTVTSTIMPNGGTLDIPLNLTLQQASGMDAWLNIAEVGAMTDTLDIDRSNDDIDSTPDNDPEDDAGGAADTASDDVNDGDGSGSNGDIDSLTDEDDHDPENLQVVDLALTKEIVNELSTYCYGDPITFEITIFNQGNVTANNIVINDLIPSGYSWQTANEPLWSYAAPLATTTIASQLLPGTSTTVSMTLTVEQALLGNYTNIAEIGAFTNADGSQDLSNADVDSTPDTNFTDDAGGNPNGNSDNVVDGNGNGTPGSNSPSTDEDDNDPAIITRLKPKCTIISNSPVCFGEDLELEETSGQASSWSWTGPNGYTSTDQNPTVSNPEAGTYSVVITDLNGFVSDTCSVDVIVSGEILVQVDTENIVCNGEANGSIDLDVIGGIPPYTYDWDNDGADDPDNDFQDLLNLSAGTYIVTITDAVGCTTTETVVITEPDVLACTIDSSTNIACFGDDSGEVIVGVTGGTMPYSYSADGNSFQPGNNLNDLSPGTYTITVEDANGCRTTCGPVTISEPAILACTTTATDASDCGTDDGTITVNAVGGTAAYSYSIDGVDFTNTTGIFNALGAGMYVVTVRDANGCESTCDALINAPNAPMCQILAQTNVACFGASTGALTVQGIGGSGTYEYSSDGTTFQTVGAFTGLAAGTYTIVVRNVGNPTCTSICVIVITENDELECALEGTNLSCNGDAMGAIEVTAIGGSGDFEYSIDGINFQILNTFTDLAAGAYTVTTRDENNPTCTVQCQITLTETDGLTCNLATTNLLCNDDDTGRITVTAGGGVAPYSYSANGSPFQPGNVFSNLAAGDYVIEIQDANGCRTTCSTATLTEPVALSCTASATDATDCFTDNGTVTAVGADGTGIYTYSLDGVAFQVNGTFTGLGAGLYTVTVRDMNGCESQCEATINAPEVPVCEIVETTNVACFGESTGAVEVMGTGGSGAYEYSIDGVAFVSSGVFTGLAAGNYDITVRNVGNPSCTSECNVVITELDILECEVIGTNLLCNADATGELFVTAIGGSGDFEFSIDGAAFQLSNTFTGLAAGDYTVTTRDENNPSCIVECTMTLIEPALLECSLAQTPTLCLGSADGTVTVAAIGGTMAYAYSIDGGAYQPGNVFTGLMSGMHTVTVEDANACITTCDIMVGEPTLLECVTVKTDATDCATDDGTITVAGSGGVGTYMYSLNGGAPQTADEFTDLAPGAYIVTIIDDNGCESMCEAEILAPLVPTCEITASANVSCFGLADGSLTAEGADGEGTYEYSLDGVNFQPIGTFMGLTAGFYTVTVTNLGDRECLSTCTVEITEPELLTCSLETTPETCILSDGTITVLPTGGTMPYSYVLNGAPAVADSIFTGLMPGAYTIDISDANGCLTQCEIMVETACFDLALIKEVVPQITPIIPGDDVTYQITVYNQGTVPAYDIEIVDYIPVDLILNDTDWLLGLGGLEAFYNYAGPLAPGDFEVIDVTFTIDPDFTGGIIDNTAEISEADDDQNPSNDPPEDYDSDPDDDPNNDGPVTDDDTDNTNDDEDDADPAEIFVQIFDLALDKSLNTDLTTLPMAPGDVITFDITVTNEGNVDAYNVEVTDYLPAYLIFDAALNAGTNWVADAAGALYDEIDFLAVGASETLSITVTIDGDYEGDMIENTAEISDADDDDDPTNNPPTDIDSEPNDDPSDDPEDEDDIDGEEYPLGQTFDLALIKEVSPTQAMPIQIGDIVEYVITVYNQGTLTAYDIEIVDYIPTGFVVTDAAWSVGTVTNEYFTTIDGPLLPDTETQVTISLLVTADAIGGTTQNFAEISSADDDTNPLNEYPTDIDSTPDNDPTDDGNYTDNDTDNTDGDEDDHDPADVFIQLFDLALDKSLNTTETTLPMAPGDVITFDITVTNEGNVDAYNVEVTDYLPSYLIFDAALNAGTNWVADAVGALYDEIDFLAVGASETLSITVTIDGDYEGDMIENTAEISDADDDDDPTNDPPTDIDSEPNDDPSDDPEDEDDIDGEEYPLGQTFDLALIKEVSPTQAMPIQIGDIVEYVITVYNQGTLTAYDIEIVDYIPTGFVVTDAAWSVGTVANEYFTTIAGPLLPDTETQVTISLQVTADAIGGTTQNFAEISSADDDTNPLNEYPTDVDSNPDNDPTDDGNYTDNDTNNTDGDEDDHDPADVFIQLFDLALNKSLNLEATTLPLAPGDAITFDIVITNQGNVDAYNVEVTDYLPAYLIFDAALNAGTNWVADAAGALYDEIDFLAVGASETLSITVTIDGDYEGDMIENTAEISDADDDDDPTNDPPTDIDSEPNDDPSDDPEDEDDIDGEEYPLGQVFDLALIKEVSPAQAMPIQIGDIVEYVITVYNQGTLTAYDIEIVDYIPTGFVVTDAAWNVGTVANEYFTTIAGPLLPDTETQVTISLLVTADAIGGTTQNFAEISSADDDTNPLNEYPTDIDSTPDNDPTDDGNYTDNDTNNTDGDEDDHDPADVFIQLFDLALDKSLNTDLTTLPMAPGDVITFDITVTNEGNVDAYNVEVTDYLPSYLIFDAALNAGTNWVADAAGALYDEIDFLAVGASETLSITVTIDGDYEGDMIENTAEISDADDDDDPTNDPPTDIDSEPNDDPSDDPEDEDDIDGEEYPLGQTFDLALIKEVSPAQAMPIQIGDIVEYVITVYNQGTLTAYDIEIVDYIPTGFVVTDAAWSVGTVTNEYFTTIDGPLLPDTETQVTISLLVTADAIGGTTQNFAEISSADDDTNPLNEYPTDIDSTPDNDPTDDGNYTDNDTNNTDGDEDDHDPADVFIQLFDLALDKTVSADTQLPIEPGSTVTFDITVTNQGNVDAYNIEVTDYLQSYFTLNDANWAANAVGAVFNEVAYLAVGMDTVIQITVDLDPFFQGSTIENTAEISDADDDDDPTNEPPTDVDSTPDGTDDDPEDEDDHDSEEFPLGQVFDLALVKQLAPSQPTNVAVGDMVEYFITVYNQGTLDAYNVEVVDYLPTGMSNADANWSGSFGSNEVFTTIGFIQAGDFATVSITVMIDEMPADGQFVNVAEVSSAEDENGDPQDDVDSTPDNDPDNDGDYTDNVTDGTNDDEDDSDPATIGVDFYDLALVKTVLSPADGMVSIGDQVTYQFEVFNQGSGDVTNVTITDYIPAGLALVDADWTSVSSTMATYTVTSVIPANSSITVPVTFTVLSSATPGDITNYGEISSFTDENGNPQEDTDSTPDSNPNNDGPSDDDTIDEDGNVVGEDEDDHDPATITFGYFDLALNKTLAGGQSSPFAPGDNVTFTFTVYNQGTIDATNVTITDYIPTGLILNDADWSSVSANEANYTLNGVIPAGTQATVNITLQISPSFTNGSLDNFGEISEATGPNGDPVDDIDSNPDDTNGNDGTVTDDATDGENGDEDDHDIESIEVEFFDLALTKALTLGQTGPFTIGDIVSYTITVYNQGTIPATDVQVVDYTPQGLANVGAGWVASADGNYYTTISGPIAPNSSASVTISFEITEDATSGSLTNYAEITEASDENGNPQDDIDSDADNNDGNDGPVVDGETNNSFGDEDDHDPETIEIAIFDLALVKTLAPGQPNVVAQGDEVDYIITVINQGSIDAYNVPIVDFIPAGFILADSDWTQITGTQAEYFINGPIPVGGDIAIEITLEVGVLTAQGDYTNYAEISGGTDENGFPQEDIDSTPNSNPNDDGTPVNDETDGSNGDEDDHDPEVITVSPLPIFDLALTKTLAPGQASTVVPGDVITYSLTVYNQGSVAASNIEITDTYPAGLTLIDGAWTDLGGNQASYTYLGTIQPGQNAIINVSFQLDNDVLATDLTNIGEISSATDDEGNPQDDIDSTPNGNPGDDGTPSDNAIDGTDGDEDDHDPETINIEVYDLALVKTLAPGQASTVAIGDNITFIIEVFNQGNMPAYDVQIVDILPAGLSLADSGWSLDIAGNAYRTIAGPIMPGDSYPAPITLTVGESVVSGDNINIGEIVDFTNEEGESQEDIDSTPDNNPNNDGAYSDNDTDGTNGDEDDHDPELFTVAEFDLALTKSLPFGAPTSYDVGDNVTYIIQVFNQGDIPATNVLVTDYLPTGLVNIDPDWSFVNASTVEYLYTDAILPGTSVQIMITTQLTADAAEGNLVNFAEISSATDLEGNPQEDVDSSADSIQNNDFFDQVNGDNNIDSINGDEDDHDPAIIQVGSNFVDIELTKVVNATEVSSGDIITYTLEVINKGPQVATNVTVSDVLPAGLQYVSANGNYDPQTGVWNIGTLGVNETSNLDINVEVIFINAPIVNVAEVDTHDQTDIDSTPGDNNGSELVTDYDDEDSATIYPSGDTVTIGNYVFIDENGDGIQDSGDTPVGGVVVNLLDENGNIIDTTVTGPNGEYYFEVAPNETYLIQFPTDIPGGDGFTTPNNGSDVLDSDVTGNGIVVVNVGDTNDLTIDAGYLPSDDDTVIIGNYVFIDENENGIQDSGDTPVGGVVVNLLDANGNIIDTTITNSNGEYYFEVAPNETYIIDFPTNVPGANGFTTPGVGNDAIDSDATGNGQVVVNVGNTDDLTIDAGYLPNEDIIESPFDCDTFNGNASTLCNYILSNPNTDLAYADCDNGGINNLTECQNGGNPYNPVDDVEDDTVIIGNYVFIDENENGIQDSGDTPLAGVTVNLLDVNGNIIATTTTDANGEYYFEVDPNTTYIVDFPTNVPGGDGFTTPGVGNDAIDSDATGNGQVVVNVGTTDDLTIDAGYLPSDDTVIIGNYVFIDENENGIQDSGDTPLAGVTVNLLDVNGNLIATTTTDANGEYYFEVDPNTTYIVDFPTNVPGGDGFTTPGVGNDGIDSDATGNGQVVVNVGTTDDLTIDAGYLPSDDTTDFVDLELTKSVNATTVTANDFVTYTISVVNKGPSTATNVVVSDELPSGLTYVSSNGNYNPIQGTWNVGTLAVGQTASIQISVSVDFINGPIVNIAEIESVDQTDIDSTPGDNNGSSNVNDYDDEDDAVIYPVTTDCNNPIECDGMGICTEAMTPVVFCPEFCIPGTVYTDIESLYNCSVSELPNGCVEYTPLPGMEVLGLDIVTIEGTAPDGSCITVEVVIQIGGCTNSIDLELTKLVNATSVSPGDFLTYTLLLENNGPDAAENIIVSDNLPAGLTFISASNGNYNANSGNWTISTLLAGQTTYLSIDVQVTAEGVIENIAQVMSVDGDDIDSTPGNGIASEDDQDNAVIVSEDVCINPPMEYCLGHMEVANICPEFCEFGEGSPYTITTDYSISDVQSIYHCSIWIYEDHCFRYTGIPGFYGDDVLLVTATDIYGNTSTVEVYITVSDHCDGSNTAPIAINDNEDTYANIPVTINVLGNDTDAEGDNLTISSYSQPANGTVQLVNGQFVFTPANDFVGTTSFTYTVSDGMGGESTATVIVEVIPYDCMNEPMNTCTKPMTRITICPEFCHFDSDYTIYTIYEITDVNSLYGCSYEILSDQCISYIPLPGLTGTDVITVFAENEAGQVSAVEVNIEIYDGCMLDDEARLGEEVYSCVEELPNLLNPELMGVSQIVQHLNRQNCLLDKDFELTIYNTVGQVMTTHKGTVGVANTPIMINDIEAVDGAYIYTIRMMDGFDSVEPMSGTIMIAK